MYASCDETAKPYLSSCKTRHSATICALARNQDVTKKKDFFPSPYRKMLGISSPSVVTAEDVCQYLLLN